MEVGAIIGLHKAVYQPGQTGSPNRDTGASPRRADRDLATDVEHRASSMAHHASAMERGLSPRTLALACLAGASGAVGSAVADRLPVGASMVPLGSFSLKGIVGPELLYRIVGPGPAIDLPPRAAHVERGPTRKSYRSSPWADAVGSPSRGRGSSPGP